MLGQAVIYRVWVMRRISLCAIGLGVFLAGAGQALADDPQIDGTNDIVFELGVGGLYSPRFEGSDNYIFAPYPIIKLHYLRIPGLYETDRKVSTIYFRPAFRFLGERNAGDDPIVRGLKPVDWALEIGAAVGYRTDYFDAYLEVRRGFNGHEGWIVDLGVDGIVHPTEDLTVKLGPRLSFADNEYMDTYFGVTPVGSVRSGYPVYNPSGGIKSIGLAGQAEYGLTPETTLYLRATYDRLIGDAGDSPIVKAGEENMFGLGIGVSYKFGLDLYD